MAVAGVEARHYSENGSFLVRIIWPLLYKCEDFPIPGLHQRPNLLIVRLPVFVPHEPGRRCFECSQIRHRDFQNDCVEGTSDVGEQSSGEVYSRTNLLWMARPSLNSGTASRAFPNFSRNTLRMTTMIDSFRSLGSMNIPAETCPDCLSASTTSSRASGHDRADAFRREELRG
jgi:hypothetical protein